MEEKKGKVKQSVFTKTKYPGVRYLIKTRGGRTERVYYALYRTPDGKLHNERVGSQFKPFEVDGVKHKGMTAALANDERTRRMRGKVKPNRQRRAELRVAREAEKAAKDAEASRWTVDRLWSEWKQVNANKRGLEKDDLRYRKHLKPIFGSKEPKDILPLEVDRLRIKMLKGSAPPPGRRFDPDAKSRADYSEETKKRLAAEAEARAAKREKKPYAVGTVVSVLSLLRRICSFGVKRRLCEGLTFKVEVPKGAKQRTEDMTPEQMDNYIRICREWADKQAGNFQLLALYTGLRRGELINLRWKDVDTGKGFITIRDPKGGEDQTIPISDAALELLKTHPRAEGNPFVFVGSGPNGERSVRQVVESSRAIRDAAGLPKDFRPNHGLRHTFGSHLASSGEVDLYVIQRLLSHKSPLMTQRYSHLRDETMRRAANVMGRVSDNGGS